MAKDDRYVRYSSQGGISPDEIANRAFSTQFRGVSEPEVRAWLKRVATEVVALREQEAELSARLEELEGRGTAPVELTEERLLTALGEETARVLRSAQEAATDIRRRAEDRSTAVLHEAQEEARRIRDEAEEVLATRTEEAEALASEVIRSAEDASRAMRSEAESAAAELRARAARDAQESDEAARRSGREIVEEAQAVRERVLADLSTRRTLLQAQLEELRGGRDRLIDAYRTVKRTLAEATEALAQVESRASTELTSGPAPAVDDPGGALEVSAGVDRTEKVSEPGQDAVPDQAEDSEPPDAVPDQAEDSEPPDAVPDQAEDSEPPDAVPDQAEDSEPPDAVPDQAEDSEPPDAVPDQAEDSEPPDAVLDQAEDSEPELHDRPSDGAEEIFARLRGDAESARPSDDDPVPHEPVGARPGGVPTDTTAEPPGASAGDGAFPSSDDGMLDEALLQRRDEVLDPAAAALARRLKRIVQDEQNTLLDALRRHRGSGGLELLLPDADAQIAERVAVTAPSVDACYREGMLCAGTTVEGGERAPDELAIALARALTDPLRARVADGLHDASARGEDEAGIAETVNARYREWKQRSLEPQVIEALTAAFARGTFDAVAPGVALRWVVDDPTACPDCDDNSLEVTAKGEPFPTGQPCPPAHPGCRCAVRIADVGTPFAGATKGSADRRHAP